MMQIAAMDSTFFDAYNKCDMDKQAEIYMLIHSEFYHEGGLMTSTRGISRN
jgi:hypothetical protein